MLTSVAISSVFAHLASKDIFGQYNFILSLLALFSLFSMPGLNNSVLQSVARGFEGSYKISVKMSFLWSLLAIPFIFSLGVYYYYYNNPIIGICLMISTLFFPFLNAPNTWDGFLQGKQRFDLNAKYGIIQGFINAIAIITVLFLDPNNLILIFTTYIVTNSILTTLLFLKSLKYIENKKEDKECLGYGYFLTASNIVGTLSSNIDRIIIGIFLGPVALATYAVAVSIPLVLKDFIKYFWSPFTPKICKDEFNTGHILKKIDKKIIALAIALIVIGSVLYWEFIGTVIVTLFGEKYYDSIFYSQILIMMLWISIPNILLGTISVAKKKKNAIIGGYYVFPALKIIIMVILMYFYGIYGAILGLVLSWSIQTLIMGLMIRR